MTAEVLAKQGSTTYSNMAESVLARVYELRKKTIQESFRSFQSQEHRLEFVAKIRGVEYVNDSMASNINATWYALENVPNPIIWIVGGQIKDTDFSQLKSLVRRKVKAIICLGVDNAAIIEAFDSIVPSIVQTQSAMNAVQEAYYAGIEGDTVLLSPACPSFDLFESYEDRGIQFRKAVNEL